MKSVGDPCQNGGPWNGRRQENGQTDQGRKKGANTNCKGKKKPNIGASNDVQKTRSWSGVDWKVENPNGRIRHQHAEIGSRSRGRRTSFTTSMSRSGVGDSPTATLLTPMESLVLDFLGIGSAGRRRNCAPRFMLVGAILTVPRRTGRSCLTGRRCQLWALVGPMTRFSALVTIALLG